MPRFDPRFPAYCYRRGLNGCGKFSSRWHSILSPVEIRNPALRVSTLHNAAQERSGKCDEGTIEVTSHPFVSSRVSNSDAHWLGSPHSGAASVAFSAFLHVDNVAFFSHLNEHALAPDASSRRLVDFGSQGQSQIGKLESKVCTTTGLIGLLLTCEIRSLCSGPMAN